MLRNIENILKREMKMSKEIDSYSQKLLNMSYVELDEESKRVDQGQKETKSDFFFWAWENQRDQVNAAKDKLMRKLLDEMVKRYSTKRLITYLTKQAKIEKAREELKKLEAEQSS